MHDQPGVYALLVGSGTSTGAGIPTGWGVIKDLVAKAAAAEGTVLTGQTDQEIEAWWDKHGDGNELGYSNLLENLGDTAAARSSLLHQYFEPTATEREAGLKVPGKAHQAIAELARRGSVRVIITTNFDGLIEQALQAASVPHQVIANDADVEARKPLAHAKCTVVKIHGDYRSLNQKNTVGELSGYSPELTDLLQEVFENYGLVINGWSADWDHALVAALRGRKSRRYPLYWSTMHQLGMTAAAVAEQHGAGVIENMTADEFFPDFVHRLESLDAMSAPPLSEEMALARLKKLLPHRESYIEIRDLLGGELEKITQAVKARGQLFPIGEDGSSPAAFEKSCLELRETSRVLVRLVATGVMLDRDRIHSELWTWAVQRLLKARVDQTGTYHDAWVKLAHYPALLLLRAIAMIAVTYNREDVFIGAATEPTWKSLFVDSPLPAFLALQDGYVVDHELAKAMPRWTNKWLYPASELVSADTGLLIADLIGEPAEVVVATRRAEYRMAMSMHLLFPARTLRPCGGRYAGERAWVGGTNIWEADFRKYGDHKSWGWAPVPSGETDPFDEKLNVLSGALQGFNRWA